jgi:uncharacterized protein (TIGR03435 family)
MRRKIVLFVAAASALLGQTAGTATWTEFSIGPPTRNQAGFSPHGIRADGIYLRKALAKAYDLPEHRVIGPDWLDTERYAITGQVENPADFKPLFQQELTARFHMIAHLETKEVPVYLLKTLDGGAMHPPASEGGAGRGLSGGLKMPHATVATFASFLADYIKRPVFDETGMDGSFDFSLSWNKVSQASLQEAVKQQLGLQLVDDKRSLQLLIVEHIEKLQFAK